MKGNKMRKAFSLLAVVGVLCILFYSALYVITRPSLAIPPIGPTEAPATTPPIATTPPAATTPPPSAGVKLDIVTIPQDDQLRQTGTMILCSGPAPCVTGALSEQKLVAEFKIHFALNGVNVDPDSLTCIVVQKEVCFFAPSGKDSPPRQFTGESEGTNTFNISPDFECKYRKTPSDPASSETAKPGVGVLDVYFTGTVDPVFIGDHILKVVAKKGNATGSEIQDICILDFPACQFPTAPGSCTAPFDLTLPTAADYRPGFNFAIRLGAGTQPQPAFSLQFADPIYPFDSCKTISLWERNVRGTLVAACKTGNSVRGIRDP